VPAESVNVTNWPSLVTTRHRWDGPQRRSRSWATWPGARRQLTDKRPRRECRAGSHLVRAQSRLQPSARPGVDEDRHVVDCCARRWPCIGRDGWLAARNPRSKKANWAAHWPRHWSELGRAARRATACNEDHKEW